MKHRLLALSALLAAACPPPAPGLDASLPDASDAAALDAPAEGAAPPACGRPHALPSGTPPSFSGLSAPVEVYRDAMGFPHLFARTDADALFAEGYLQATDRLFQMELMRRWATGTQAEVLGRSKLTDDQRIRLFDLPRWGRESAARLLRERPEVARLVAAWVAGVNRRIAELDAGTAPLPTGFGPSEYNFRPQRWTFEDPLTISRLILFGNAGQLEYDILATTLARYAPAAAVVPLFQTATEAYILPPEERPAGARMLGAPPPPPAPRPLPADAAARLFEFSNAFAPLRSGGSNNWAVHGRFTDNGRPLLAGDPHQTLRSPAVFWPHHVNSIDNGGTLDVAGFGFAGTPLIQLGHNRRVAWTATTAYPDMMDLFDVAPPSGGTVSLGGRRYAVERCTETIALRGESPVSYVVEDVPGVGVLLPRDFTPLPLTDDNHRLLFRWTGFGATNEASVFYDFDRAQSAADFDRAATQMEVGSFNFVFADASSLGYRSHVLVPDRGSPADLPPPWRVVPGDGARGQWTGAFLSADQQPHSSGGTRGFLGSANNDPFGFTSNGRTEDDPWYYGVWFDPGTRARRIEDELERLTARASQPAGAVPVTAQDLQDLQLDTYSVLAEQLLPALRAAWTAAQTDPALATFRADPTLAPLVAQLLAWDRRMQRDAPEPALFEAWEHFFAYAALGDDFGPLFDAIIAAEPVYMLKILSQAVNGRFAGASALLQEGRDTLALRALVQARAWLSTRFPSGAPRWQDLHETRMQAPFDDAQRLFALGPYATNGSIGTVNVSQSRFFASGGTPNATMTSTAGAVYRMVASFDADGTPRARVCFASGVSGDPRSPRWGDGTGNTTAWREGRYQALPFARAAVETASTEHSTLAP